MSTSPIICNGPHSWRTFLKPGAVRKLFGAKRPGAIDEYLDMMSKDKDHLNAQVRGLLQQPTKVASLSEILEAHVSLLEEMDPKIAAKIPVVHGTFSHFETLKPAASEKVVRSDPNPQGVYVATRRRAALPLVAQFARDASQRHGGAATIAHAKIDTAKGWIPHQLTEWGKKHIGDLDEAEDLVASLDEAGLSAKERGEAWQSVQKGIGSWKNRDLSTSVRVTRYKDVKTQP